jgi:cobalt transporter subunit CbtA
MIQRMLSSAMFAGCAAGLLAVLLHFAFVERFILIGEQYESGELVHFQGADGHHDDHAMAAEGGIPQAKDQPTTEAAPTDAASGHAGHDGHGSGKEASPLKRHGLTVLFAALIYSGFALLLVSGYAMAGQFGQKVMTRDGLLWGLAGFVALQLAPAMGLSPELPGTMGAALEARQLWWVGTAIATAGGLGLLAFGRTAVVWAVGLILLAAPHIIGAPEVSGFSGVAPPELAAGFAARSLGVGLCAWVFLGGFLAHLWQDKTA